MTYNKNLLKLAAKVNAIREKAASMVSRPGGSINYEDPMRVSAYTEIPGASYPSVLSLDPTTNPILNPFRNLDFGRDGGGSITGGVADMLLPNDDASYGRQLVQNLGDFSGAYAGGAIGGNLLNQAYNRANLARLGLSPRTTPADLANVYPSLFTQYYGLQNGARFGTPNTSVLAKPSSGTALGVPMSMIPGVNLGHALVGGSGRTPIMPPDAVTALPDTAGPSRSAAPVVQPNISPGAYGPNTGAAQAFLQTAQNLNPNPSSQPAPQSNPSPASQQTRQPMTDTVFIEPLRAGGAGSGKPVAVNPNERLTSRVNAGRARAERAGGATGLALLLIDRLRRSGGNIGGLAAPASTAVDINPATGGAIDPQDTAALINYAGQIPKTP